MVSRDPETFSSADGIHLRRTATHQFRPNMINMDDPAHQRIRKLVSSGFTPRVLRTFRTHYGELARQVVDRALAGAGPSTASGRWPPSSLCWHLRDRRSPARRPVPHLRVVQRDPQQRGPRLRPEAEMMRSGVRRTVEAVRSSKTASSAVARERERPPDPDRRRSGPGTESARRHSRPRCRASPPVVPEAPPIRQGARRSRAGRGRCAAGRLVPGGEQGSRKPSGSVTLVAEGSRPSGSNSALIRSSPGSTALPVGELLGVPDQVHHSALEGVRRSGRSRGPRC